MLSNRLTKAISSAVLVLAASVFLTDCTSMITEEQLSQLKELRRQEAQLSEDIIKAKSELQALKTELNNRKSELNDCNDQTAFVKEKLSKWPDVWPDNQ